MRGWSELAERLAATTRTSEKTSLLADYLHGLAPDALPVAAVFLTGRPFAEADQRSTGLGWSAIAATVAKVAGVPRSALGEAYDRSSDLGLAVAEVLTDAGHEPPPEEAPTLPEVAAAFAEIQATSGPARKSAILEALLRRADPLTAKSIVKVLSGDLRIGLREGLVVAAIAKAFDRPLDDVKWAGMLVGDVGRLAELARDDQLAAASLEVFHPLQFMLASPAEDATEIITRLGPEVWVEDKYDGIRCQLHKRGADVRLYSRDLNDISSGYPEIVDAAAELPWDGILDGEILGWRDGLVLPFIALQGRLGRKVPSAAILAEVPVIFVAFDVLAVGPGGDQPIETLLRAPLAARRARLDALDLPLTADGGRFARSLVVSASDADAIEAAFEASRARRNEGLMVKDPDSIYAPGRRGLGWLKMKKALATIDCVVVGVEVGHGKRHGVLSDYTFAVRDTVNRPSGQHRQGLQRADRCRDRRHDPLVRGAHDLAPRPLSRGRADGRRRDRVRRHRPFGAPRLGLLTQVPADRRAPSGQERRRDRHGRIGDRAVRGIAARVGTAGDRRSALDGQVQPAAPFGPAAVIDRDVLVAEQGQDEREFGGRDAGPVVADHPPSARHIGLVEQVAQLLPVAQPLAAGFAGRPDREVDGARDMAEALGIALEPEVLGGRPGVEQDDIGRSEQPADVGRGEPRPVRSARGEPARPGGDHRIRDRALLGRPGRIPAVEDPHRLVTVRAQAPPGPGGEQPLGVVVDHDRGIVRDPGPRREVRHLVRAGEQDRVACLGFLDQLGAPVDEDGPRDVAGRVDRRRAAVRPPAQVQDPNACPVQVVRQPLCRGQDLRAGQATHARYHTAVVAPFMPDPEKLTAVRAAIPALSAGIYLATGSVGPLPAETAAAMAEMADHERDLGRGHPDDLTETLARMAEARAGVAAVLGTDVAAVGLTHSTTDAMNAATQLPDWRTGGRVVTTAHEHAGGVGPLYALRQRTGAEIVFVEAGDDGDDERTMAAFDDAITPGTRLVAISHVLWTTGAVLPVARIAAMAHERGALVVVDGAQAAGAIPFRFDELGVGPVRAARPEVAPRT